MSSRLSVGPDLTIWTRSKLKKQRKRLGAGKNKKRLGIEISRVFGNGNVESAVVEEGVGDEAAEILIVEDRETPGLLHLDDEVLLAGASFAVLRQDVTLIRTFLQMAEVDDVMKVGDGELAQCLEDQLPVRLHLPDTDGESTSSHDPVGLDILQTGIDHHLRTILMREEEGGLLTAVTNGQSPSPLLIPLAHVHLEDTGGGDLLLSHHVALLHHQD